MPVPAQPKIFHIVHVDRLASILGSNGLLCDAQIIAQQAAGTTIGMNTIKQRRLTELTLDSHPGLYVGQCVPFYFCPRSIMLYVIHRADSDELAYKGGQSTDYSPSSRSQCYGAMGAAAGSSLGIYAVKCRLLLL